MSSTGPAILAELRTNWRAMVAIVVGMCITGIPAYAIGAFVAPLSAEFGWSVPQITGWSLAWSAGCITAAPFVGQLADRVGPRRVALIAATALGVALAATAFAVASLPAFYASGFAIGATVAGASGITFGRVVTSRFDRGLGTALGLMSTGIGLSAVIGPRLMQAIIDAQGWRVALALESLLAVALIPLLWLWLGDRTGATGAARTEETGHDLQAAMRMPVFWMLTAGAVIYGLGVGGVSVNLIPYLTSEGIDRASAAGAASLFGAATIAGRFVTGIVIDRVRVHPAVMMAAVLTAEAAAFVLLGWTGPAILIVALPIFGLAVGAEADCLAYCTAKFFGRRHYASIFGIVGVVALYVGTGLGPLLFALLRDALGSYALALYWWAALVAVAIPIFLAVSRRRYHAPA